MIEEIKEINMWLDLFTWENVGNVMAILLVALVVMKFIRAVTSTDNDLNLLDIFLPLGSAKMRLNGTWFMAMIVLALEAVNRSVNLPVVLAAILTAFVADQAFSRKDKKSEPPKKDES